MSAIIQPPDGFEAPVYRAENFSKLSLLQNLEISQTINRNDCSPLFPDQSSDKIEEFISDQLNAGAYVTCYTFNIDRKVGWSGFISFAVVSFESSRDTDIAPTVYLKGGFTGQSVDSMDHFAATIYRFKQLGELLGGGDYIFPNLRGTNGSSVTLKCSRYYQYIYSRRFSKSPDHKKEWEEIEDPACLNEFFGEGRHSLLDFSLKERVADLILLRRESKIDQWNFMGSSFGTRTAVWLAGQDAIGTRSVVLDGVDIFDGPYTHARQAGFDRRMMLLNFDGDKDKTQELQNDIREVYEIASKKDIFYYNSVDKNQYVFDDRLLIRIIFRYLYYPSPEQSISWLMRDLRRLARDLSDNVSYAAAGKEYVDTAIVHMTSVTNSRFWGEIAICTEYKQDTKLPEIKTYPYRSISSMSRPQESCGKNGEFVIAFEELPFGAVSQLPVLLLSGFLDPITPPSHGEFTARKLNAKCHHVYDGVGHGVIGWDYGPSDVLVLNFLHDPIHYDCASKLIDF